MYSGSMRITNQVFEDAYENSNSSEFKALAKQVTTQVRLHAPPRPQKWNSAIFFLFVFVFSNSLHSRFVVILLPSLSAEGHLFQKSTVVQILRWFYSSGFQVWRRSWSWIISCNPLLILLPQPRGLCFHSCLSVCSWVSVISQKQIYWRKFGGKLGRWNEEHVIVQNALISNHSLILGLQFQRIVHVCLFEEHFHATKNGWDLLWYQFVR